MLPRNQAKKKFNQPHFFNNTFRQFTSNFNPNQMRNELTINVTKNEPRLVIYNQQKTHQNFHPNPHHHHQLPNHQHVHPPPYAQSRPQAIPSFKYSKHNQSHSYSKTYTNTNRYKFINNHHHHQVNKLKAPYNTTQYLMYDYSKRRVKDQQCPDEQQQFTNDWNMALNQNEQQNDEGTKFFVCRRMNADEEDDEDDDQHMEHDDRRQRHDDDDDEEEQHNQHQNNNRLKGLKKSLSDLDLVSDNDLSNFFSTSI